MDRPAIRVCEAFAHAGYPLDVEALLIIEVEGSRSEIADLIDRITRDRGRARAVDLQGVAIGSRERRDLEGPQIAPSAPWAASPTICAWTAPSRPASCRACSPASREICAGYGLEVANIFHAGDGNLHQLVLFNANQPGELEKAEAAGADILKLCVEVGGCLTGEHGVGVEKRDLMIHQFNTVELDQQMRVKTRVRPATGCSTRTRCSR